MKNPYLHRYWIEFDLPYVPGGKSEFTCYHALLYGCGVTAYTVDDALMILEKQLRLQCPLPSVLLIIEDIDVSMLNIKHRFPTNMCIPTIGVTIFRGTWFPDAGPYTGR
jgi:hypothetical protein